ncbi:MAG: taurine dioxygenase [Rhodospirillaceae bacterium]|nr:taurine dioxygenase [Rhodospirillaceae bacterium]|tara:strand:+ start:617 stop:1465 length:849 start_codon:yes stop_codon:yes gene_type:complete
MEEYRQLSYALGAEINGISLKNNLSAQAISFIKQIWNEHHVILLREQAAEPEDLIAFASSFGSLDDHASTPYYRLDGFPQLMEITTREFNGRPSETRNVGRNWHSDYSYTQRPAAASMLFCVEPAPLGGDTMFCNMVKAYENLSETMRKIVDGLHSVYDFGLTAGLNQRDAREVAETHKLNPPIAHPAVRTHPESGKKALYVSERVSYFYGMTIDESRPIIDYLCHHATRAENVYRHSWSAGDLVCWDNRTTMHIALTDFDQTLSRHMLRATLLGEKSGFVV